MQLYFNSNDMKNKKTYSEHLSEIREKIKKENYDKMVAQGQFEEYKEIIKTTAIGSPIIDTT